jgi:hypothetical protein
MILPPSAIPIKNSVEKYFQKYPPYPTPTPISKSPPEYAF